MIWENMSELEVYNEVVKTLEFTIELTEKGDLADLKDYLRAMVSDITRWQEHNK